MQSRCLFILLALWAFLLLSGCVKQTPQPWVSNLLTKVDSKGQEEILDLREGDKISFRQLLIDLEGTKVIFVGETHDQIEHHQIQIKILQGLLERGKDVVVGMEMFERSQQPVLDPWPQGQMTEEEFLKEVNWETTWGMDYHFYRGILDEVRGHHLKLLGLNVQRELVRKVAESGIEGLSPEDKRGLPEMDLADQQHRIYIRSIYRAHKGGSAKGFNHFYQAQALWDEGMAESLSTFLKSSEGQGKTLLVFVGRGHVMFDFGIPKRLYRRIPIPYKTVVLKEWKKGMEEDLDFTFSKASSLLADYLWITQPSPPGKRRPMIGVVLKRREDSGGVWIERVIPGSPAHKAGLLSGDQFGAIEGKEIKEVKDIHHALAEKGWGKVVTITVIRQGVKKEITVSLPPLRD